jgi:hypothetical protein
MIMLGTAITWLAGALLESAGILLMLGGSPLGDAGFEWKRFAAGAVLFSAGLSLPSRKQLRRLEQQ